jgi:pentatricopeptide repeat protein
MATFCAESRHVQMVERLLAYAQQKGKASLAMYTAVMKVYQCARLFSKTCDLFGPITKEGVELDNVAYGCMIKAAVESGRLELARKLFQQSGNPDLLNYMSLIRAAGRERNAPKALALLKEVEQSPILAVDTTAYNCVLDVCVACGAEAGGASRALELFERMKEVQHVDVISYNTLLKLLMKQQSWAKVEQVLEEMRGRGLKPNVVTYNSLINAFISAGDMASAWRHLEDMEKYGVQMDAYTCSIMMKGLKHSNRKEDMDRILGLMDKSKVVPDEVLMNTLLDACMRLRDPRRLNDALNQFKASGVVPSMHAHAVLIKAYGQAHRLDQAWKVWRELMHDRRTHPNEEVYGAMIDACMSSDDLDAASKLFVEMKKQLPTSSRLSFQFAGLVKAFTQRKQMDRAMEFYEQVSDGGACNLVTYNTLIDTYARVGDMEKCSKMFADMCERGVDPDLITYSTVIKGYCVQGNLEEAIELFSMMQKRGVTPDGILFNSILDGCARKQMRTLTERVLRDMEVAKVPPSNFTLSILVKLYGRLGDVDKAFEVVETYPAKYGFDVNAIVYTCLMTSCISNDDVGRAMRVFEQMKASKCAPDSKTYSTLVNGCLKKDKLEEAVKLVDDAMGLGTDCVKKCDGPAAARLDRETIESVLFAINRRQKSQELGAPLMERLRKAGVEVTPRASSAANRSAAQNVGSTSSRFHARRAGF